MWSWIWHNMKWRCFLVFLSCVSASSEVWATWNDSSNSSTTWNDDVFVSSSLLYRLEVKFELHKMTVQIALLHEMTMFSCLPLLSAGYQWSLSYMKWRCFLVFLSCLQATSEAWVTWNDGLHSSTTWNDDVFLSSSIVSRSEGCLLIGFRCFGRLVQGN